MLVVPGERVPVVPELPPERVPEVERPLLQGLVGEEAERDDEEDRQPEQTRRQQKVRDEAAVTVEEAHSAHSAK